MDPLQWMGAVRMRVKKHHNNPQEKVIAHWVRNFRVRFSVFLYSSSFPIKMHVKDAKTLKIEPDSKNFMTDESFGGSV